MGLLGVCAECPPSDFSALRGFGESFRAIRSYFAKVQYSTIPSVTTRHMRSVLFRREKWTFSVSHSGNAGIERIYP